MKALVKDRYDELSYKVFNIGNANLVSAYSSEITIPMDGRHIEAVERVFDVADRQRRLGNVYQSSPIALRFVKQSPAYLSMMHGHDTSVHRELNATRVFDSPSPSASASRRTASRH